MWFTRGVGVASYVEFFRGHADDGMRCGVDTNRSPDDPGVGAKAIAPQAVAQDDDRRRADHTILGQEPATEPWSQTQYVEEIGRYSHPLNPCGARAVGEVERAGGEGRHPLQALRFGVQVEVITGRQRQDVSSLFLADPDQAIRIRERQRA